MAVVNPGGARGAPLLKYFSIENINVKIKCSIKEKTPCINIFAKLIHMQHSTLHYLRVDKMEAFEKFIILSRILDTSLLAFFAY